MVKVVHMVKDWVTTYPWIWWDGPDIWLSVEAMKEEHAETLYNALHYILNGKISLEEIRWEGTTIAMMMKIKSDKEEAE